MERWLSVENNIITISQLSFDDVAWCNIDIGLVFSMREVDGLSVMSNDPLGTWPFCWSIIHKLLHLFDIFICYVLWNCKVHCDCFRNTKLIKLKDRVRSDDSSC
jgi:hypothetical protein